MFCTTSLRGFESLRRPSYKGTPLTRLCRLIAATAALGIACGGCSYQLEDAFSKSDKRSDITGSITPAKAELPPENDLVFTRAAVKEVLSRGSKDAAVAWENPTSGARGIATPLASAYSQDGTTCRDFLASYVHKDNEAWMQGEACRSGAVWEIRSMKPWKRT